MKRENHPMEVEAEARRRKITGRRRKEMQDTFVAKSHYISSRMLTTLSLEWVTLSIKTEQVLMIDIWKFIFEHPKLFQLYNYLEGAFFRPVVSRLYLHALHFKVYIAPVSVKDQNKVCSLIRCSALTFLACSGSKSYKLCALTAKYLSGKSKPNRWLCAPWEDDIWMVETMGRITRLI